MPPTIGNREACHHESASAPDGNANDVKDRLVSSLE